MALQPLHCFNRPLPSKLCYFLVLLLLHFCCHSSVQTTPPPPTNTAAAIQKPVTAHVLNLPNRPDRWESFQQRWNGVKGLEFKRENAMPHYPSPFKSPSGVLDGGEGEGEGGQTTRGFLANGCTASHIRVVEEAFAEDSSRVRPALHLGGGPPGPRVACDCPGSIPHSHGARARTQGCTIP